MAAESNVYIHPSSMVVGAHDARSVSGLGGRSFSSDIILSTSNGLQPLRNPALFRPVVSFLRPSAPLCVYELSSPSFSASIAQPIVILSAAKNLNFKAIEIYQ